MNTLLLRLAGPMQSWGTQSRFTERDTGMEPSLSGVVGLLCAALGMERDATCAPLPQGGSVTLDTLADLRMAVRVEREGSVEHDFHTAGGQHRATDKGYGVLQANGKVRTVVSKRAYLADADFLVGLGSEDVPLLNALHAALRAPCWPLFLGRRAFVPGVPVWMPSDPVRDSDPYTVLTQQPWLAARDSHERSPTLRLVVDTRLVPGITIDDGARRQDVPRSFTVSAREYDVRYVYTELIDPPTENGGKTDVAVTTPSQSA